MQLCRPVAVSYFQQSNCKKQSKKPTTMESNHNLLPGEEVRYHHLLECVSECFVSFMDDGVRPYRPCLAPALPRGDRCWWIILQILLRAAVFDPAHSAVTAALLVSVIPGSLHAAELQALKDSFWAMAVLLSLAGLLGNPWLFAEAMVLAVEVDQYQDKINDEGHDANFVLQQMLVYLTYVAAVWSIGCQWKLIPSPYDLIIRWCRDGGCGGDTGAESSFSDEARHPLVADESDQTPLL